MVITTLNKLIQIGILRMFRRYGANFNQPDHEGKTPISILEDAKFPIPRLLYTNWSMSTKDLEKDTTNSG